MGVSGYYQTKGRTTKLKSFMMMGSVWTYYQTKEFHDGSVGRTTKLKSFMMGVSWTYYQTKEFHDGGQLDVLPN